MTPQPSVLPTGANNQRRLKAEELFYNSYKCRQLYTLLESGHFEPSLTWLSAKLDADPGDIASFLEALIHLGLVERTSAGFSASSHSLKIKEIEPLEHVELTRDLLGDFPAQSSESLFFCVATDESLRREFLNQLKDLVQSFCFRSRSSAKTLIYSVSLSATKIKENEGAAP